MALYRIPGITWGTSFANTLVIGYPLDNAIATSKNREGSEYIQSPSGDEDAWLVGADYMLDGDIRWIPTTDSTNPTQTGWDTSVTGFLLFLAWARAKNQFRWIPDITVPGTYIASYLVNTDVMPTLEADGTRAIHISMRNPTTAYTGY